MPPNTDTRVTPGALEPMKCAAHHSRAALCLGDRRQPQEPFQAGGAEFVTDAFVQFIDYIDRSAKGERVPAVTATWRTWADSSWPASMA